MTTVSIITATYNSGVTINDTLRSVALQNHHPVEHLIIDGVSTDNTLDIVEQFPHVAKLVSEKDKGIYDAMNKGIGLATGDIIGILNSDDFYASASVISEVVNAFETSGCDAVYGDLDYVDRDDTGLIRRHWKSGLYKQGSFKWGWMPPHPTFFVRRSVYQKFGLFNLSLGTAADYELMLRFIHKNGISLAYLPKVLIKMRTGGASNLSLIGRLAANKADREAWTQNGMKPYWFTLYLKPLRKLGQFLRF